MSDTAYRPFAKLMHWSTVVFVLLAWVLGLTVDAFPKAFEPTIVFTHISLGLLVIIALVLRLGWRAGHAAPLPEPTPFDPWAHRLAALGHLALYVLLLVVPLLGIAYVFSRGRPLQVFGLFQIPSPWVDDRALGRQIREAHELAAHALVALAALHAAAAVVHHVVWKDRTLLRMLPGRRSA